ncbi:Imm64 family immunity protein [Exiguobacterium sp. s16]|uniref:Imm64 family immunity protein n=1 Tax=Exiguobacterium sp. s16 TaxID=2751237 RepID=UPI001BE8CE2D
MMRQRGEGLWRKGGFVSIGIAFTKGIGLSRSLEAVCEKLIDGNGRIINTSYSEDEGGSNWVTVRTEEAAFDVSHSQFYGSVRLTTTRFGRRDQIVTVSLRDELEFDGLLIDLDYEDVFPDETKSKSHVEISKYVERLLVDLYGRVPFAYAVASHEMEWDWAPATFHREIESMGHLPLSVVPVDGGINMYHGSIALDGMTPQPNRMNKIRL